MWLNAFALGWVIIINDTTQIVIQNKLSCVISIVIIINI